MSNTTTHATQNATKRMVHAGLVACRKALPDLFTRNWSGQDSWQFAVYTRDDCFVGCVSVTSKAFPTDQARGCWGPSKRDAATLTEFCRVFNAALQANPAS